MNVRVNRLREELDRLDASTVLVAESVNVKYVTGFASSNAAVLVGRDRLVLVTDGRYIESARCLDGLEAVQADRDIASWLGERLGELAEPPVAFEANRLTYSAYEGLASSGLELRPAKGVVEDIRSVKDESELTAIRRSARVNYEAFERLAKETFVGRTEAEVAWTMEQALHDAGAEALAFGVIVASGPNAARPHHYPGTRTIERDETVIVDAGAVVGGYFSDCTRTFATGVLPDDLQAAYDACRRVQAEALDDVRAGADARQVDADARTSLETAGYEVMHGLGHGVGLELQELPVLRPTANGLLGPGNVVTVEPGVYLAGRGGVRIEDLVIVTEGEPEVLTPFTKDLVTLN
ncbi:MAG: Xaa-Pro peptidase family protein [Actinomycetota bacterium]|nr:Xaa-Pro peptidase family protein [Actinomycetota bacterium]